MDDIGLALDRMSFTQMVLAWAFVGCYALSLGGMLGPKGSRRAALAAVLAAVLFCVFSDYWVHGALLVLFAVGGMGAFVAAAWVLMRSVGWFVEHGHRPAPPAPVPRVRTKAQPIGVVLRELWRSVA